MPRIKAITTGSVPSFLDVILNFAESDRTSSLETQDTWLAQLKAKRDGRLVLYGDDTWLKLFPTTFSRADGTSSFFVSDFTEVDDNVTRNLPAELNNRDWNGMILHYLGLDHIGHKSGPNRYSPHMIPKQAEMDGVVRTIYHAIEEQGHLRSTMLVLCGDHGMNDAGNHGGSSAGETSPALIFISPKLRSISEGVRQPVAARNGTFEYYERVEQSDVAPTLAALLGFPVPRNNLGDTIDILDQNAKQVLAVLQETFPGIPFDGRMPADACTENSSDGIRLACLWSCKATSAHDELLNNGNIDGAALRTVCLLPVSGQRTNQTLVSKRSTTHDEQNCQQLLD
ncbi:MAG: hypothetical protein L6R39_007640 [Caloplaca ligustica]|nr:MAG: hypothetical protein L6R39_007640 [Caloplaca ligustica]